MITGKRRVSVLVSEKKSEEEIHKIIKSNSRWIFQKQLHIQEKKKKHLTYSNGSKLPYLGKEYSLNVIDLKDIAEDKKEIDTFVLREGKFVAKIADMNHDKIKSLYEKWLEKQGSKLLKKRIHDYCKVIGLDHRLLKIKVKSQRKRVASLGRNLVLNFNRTLLRLPLKIIDYVIVHELCHIEIPDHSPAYWQLVGLIIRDYKKRKEWLEINRQAALS